MFRFCSENPALGLNRRAIGSWLLLSAMVVFVMVVVGGITRLTQSGLSMVEWAPLFGILPPMGIDAWEAVFEKYQQFPEYQKINFGMSLEDFKLIFWWEFSHRVLGRFIGLMFFVPFLFFLFKGWLNKQWTLRFVCLLVLGGLQGVMGWYMVVSGLVDNPHVSQYRLVAHLILAVVIYAVMLWYAFDFLFESRQSEFSAAGIWSALLPIVVLIMITSGGFVAGTKAGFIINTFPTMNGEWLPSGIWAMTPGWRNLFENVVTIQFVHRCMAILVLLVAAIAVSKVLKIAPDNSSLGTELVIATVLIQIVLGIAALLNSVPISLGATHQAGALFVLAASIYMAHAVRRQPVLQTAEVAS
jgi:cytochrome c oxidase assembly protein subunit 15